MAICVAEVSIDMATFSLNASITLVGRTQWSSVCVRVLQVETHTSPSNSSLLRHPVNRGGAERLTFRKPLVVCSVYLKDETFNVQKGDGVTPGKETDSLYHVSRKHRGERLLRGKPPAHVSLVPLSNRKSHRGSC